MKLKTLATSSIILSTLIISGCTFFARYEEPTTNYATLKVEKGANFIHKVNTQPCQKKSKQLYGIPTGEEIGFDVSSPAVSRGTLKANNNTIKIPAGIPIMLELEYQSSQHMSSNRVRRTSCYASEGLIADPNGNYLIKSIKLPKKCGSLLINQTTGLPDTTKLQCSNK